MCLRYAHLSGRSAVQVRIKAASALMRRRRPWTNPSPASRSGEAQEGRVCVTVRCGVLWGLVLCSCIRRRAQSSVCEDATQKVDSVPRGTLHVFCVRCFTFGVPTAPICDTAPVDFCTGVDRQVRTCVSHCVPSPEAGQDALKNTLW